MDNKFLPQSFIQNYILICDKCKTEMNGYDKPKFLPCHKTICSKCELTIIKEANSNKEFKCGVCSRYHFIPDEGFVLDKTKYALITAELVDVSRGNEHIKLQSNLNRLNSSARDLKYLFEKDGPIEKLKEHCSAQINLIDESAESKIVQIHVNRENLIKSVKEYEKKQTEHFISKKESIMKEKEKTNSLINSVTNFSKEKQAYLNKHEADDNKMETFSRTSEELETKLNEESNKLTNLLYNNKLIEFEPNLNEIDESAIGKIGYEIMNPYLLKVLSTSDDKIKLWDLESSTSIRTFVGHASLVNCVRKTYGNIIISGSNDFSIKIWNISNGECIKTINEHTDSVNDILILSKDTFASGSGNGIIKIFDLNTFSCIKELLGHTNEIYQLHKLSDDKIISRANSEVIIWDLNTCTCQKIIQRSDYYLHVLSEKILAFACENDGEKYNIQIYNIENEAYLKTLEGHTNIINCIANISDEIIASSSDDGTIKIWNTTTGECLETIQFGGIPDKLKILTKNKIICNSSQKIKVWDRDSGGFVKTLKGDTCFILDIEVFE